MERKASAKRGHSGSPEASVGPWRVRDRYTMQKEFGYRVYLLDYGGVRERGKEREVGEGDREGRERQVVATSSEGR